MAEPNTHRILSETILASTPHASEAYEVATRLREAMAGELGSALESALDRVAASLGVGSATLRLDRLEIRTSGSTIDEAITRLASDLPRTLIDALRTAGESAGANEAVASGVELVPDARLWEEILVELLCERRLPWSVQHQSQEETRAGLAAAAERLWDSPDVIDRLGRVVASVAPRAAFERVTTLLRLSMPRRELVVSVVERRVKPPIEQPLASLLVLLRRGESSRGHHLTQELEREAAALAIGAAFSSLEDADTFAAVQPSPALREAMGSAVDSSPETQAAPRPTSARDIDAPPIDRPAATTQSGHRQIESRGERVHGAGLVLLHPFLPALLSHLDLLSVPDRRVPHASLDRAAAVLSYLATGHDAPFEHELGLIRLLLGAPEALSIANAEVRLSSEERAESDALLHSVIGHWTSLRRTSIAGLREGFLRRGGTLHRAELARTTSEPTLSGSDRLVVDPAGHDILLASIPWSITIVKLPWMPTPLMIDWPTP